MVYKIIKTDEFKKPVRAVKKVFLHCSASDAEGSLYEGTGLAMTIKKWHLQRGFTDVGYHLLLDKKGNIITGRPLETIPAAQKGFNTGSIAICCHGLEKTKFPSVQLIALKNLCQKINSAYNGKVSFHGHHEVEPNKTCPVYDYKKLLGLDEQGFIKG